MKQHNPELLDKDRLLAITKTDMLDDELETEIKLNGAAKKQLRKLKRQLRKLSDESPTID